MNFALLAFTVFAFAWPPPPQNMSGYLVDGPCYQTREENNNPSNADDAVNRDRDLEIRLCYPNAKTKQFIFVDHDGTNFRLDAAGDDKAANLARQIGKTKKGYVPVSISGEVEKSVLKVDSISLER